MGLRWRKGLVRMGWYGLNGVKGVGGFNGVEEFGLLCRSSLGYVRSASRGRRRIITLLLRGKNDWTLERQSNRAFAGAYGMYVAHRHTCRRRCTNAKWLQNNPTHPARSQRYFVPSNHPMDLMLPLFLQVLAHVVYMTSWL